MVRSKDLKTPLAVVSFAQNLFEARTDDFGKSSYGCTLLFPKTADISELKNLALEAAKEEWGDKALDWIKNEVIKSPFLDGDGKQGRNKDGEPMKGFTGHTFIRCKSGAEYKPKVFDKHRNPVFDKGEVPSGSQVYAVVNAFTWDNPRNGKGITFGISLVQVVKKATGDEVLGGSGGPDEKQFFEKIEDTGDAPAATKDGSGAAGLFG